MTIKLHALVMAGGRGTRFWPESTSKKPKQYLKLFSDNSLLKETLMRFDDLIIPESRFIITVQEQKVLAEQESQNEVGDDNIILEPAGRNTAPCILLSLASLVHKGAKMDDVVVVVPSDHVILNQNGFREVIKDAAEFASKHKTIVTIGIPPTFPHTGYGYIFKGVEVDSGIFDVKEFKEKPNIETAKEYLKTGNYLWNAGMFMGSIGVFLEEFQKNSPETFEYYNDLLNNMDSSSKIAEIYNKIPKNSIDFAVMEKSEKVQVMPARFDWNDLGSWDALEGVIDSTDGNTLVTLKDKYISDAKGNIVFAPDKFVSLIGVNDLIIVSNEKNLMIINKDEAQKVKSIVEFLENHTLKDELL